MRHNVCGLKVLPPGEQYRKLRQLVSDEKSGRISTCVSRQQVIPAYLKNRYGEINVGGSTSRGRDLPTRKKLYVAKNDTMADRVNEAFREVVSKISDNNKEQLLQIMMDLEIPDECGETLVNNLYTFAVDLSYLVHLYVEIILRLKDKNEHLYQRVIDRIISVALQPLIEGDPQHKRLRIGNLILLSSLYQTQPSPISHQTMIQIMRFLMDHVTPQNTDYLQLLCELFLRVLGTMKQISTNQESLDSLIQGLRVISRDQTYDKKSRFKIQDVLELKC